MTEMQYIRNLIWKARWRRWKPKVRKVVLFIIECAVGLGLFIAVGNLLVAFAAWANTLMGVC